MSLAGAIGRGMAIGIDSVPERLWRDDPDQDDRVNGEQCVPFKKWSRASQAALRMYS